jgi:hypothetical protein
MVAAARRPAIVGGYRHPAWLTAAGVVTALGMLGLAARTVWTTVARETFARQEPRADRIEI